MTPGPADCCFVSCSTSPPTLQFLDGILGLCAVVHFASPDRSTEAKRGARNVSPGTIVAEPSSHRPISFRSRAKKHMSKIHVVSSCSKKQTDMISTKQAGVGSAVDTSNTTTVVVGLRGGSVAGDAVAPTPEATPQAMGHADGPWDVSEMSVADASMGVQV